MTLHDKIGETIVIELPVKKALEDGYVVKAYVRNPSKSDLNHQNSEVIKGELHDYENSRNCISTSEIPGLYLFEFLPLCC